MRYILNAFFIILGLSLAAEAQTRARTPQNRRPVRTPSSAASPAPAAVAADGESQAPSRVRKRSTVKHQFLMGLGLVSYFEKTSVNRVSGPAVAANVTTLGKALKVEYALRKDRNGFRAEAFYFMNSATVQSSDPTQDYLAGAQEHSAFGMAIGPYRHFTSLATTLGVSIPFLYRNLDIKSGSSVSSVNKGTLTTYGVLLDMRWRLHERLYLEQKFGQLTDFRGPFWQAALDFRLR